ncbi:MAG: anaerobic sulfatase maturase [Spirochaetaceae bacterium]
MNIKRPFHLMTKPIGPICNLDCEYCFYLKKDKLFNHTTKKEFEMGLDLLESYTKNYIDSQPENLNEITFAWQGGEPTLLSLDFYKEAIKFQTKHKRPGMEVNNALQTNGTLITDEMAIFFKENNFLIGVSIDGPEDIHNKYRKDRAGNGSFKNVIKGVELLKKYKVDFNTLTVVQDHNSQYPSEVYNFLKALGSTFLQFIPIVEPDSKNLVSSRTVPPESLGNFMSEIFKLWAKEDVGKIYIGHFDMLLGRYMGYPASFCVHSKTCGTALAMEHNGNVYSCDHFVDPEHELGNIKNTTMVDMVNGEKQITFGDDKFDKLPTKCLECNYLTLCYGACPKNRLKDDLNYLCQGYYNFYSFTEPYFVAMANALKQGKEAKEFRTYLRFKVNPDPKRNDPCPCLSGQKFKNCCG